MADRNPHLFLCLLALLVTLPPHSQSQPLQPFEWKHRLILIRDAADEGSAIVENLEQHRTAIAERHILWFVLGEGSVESNYQGPLRDDFAVSIERAGYWQDAETVLLIGKDGGVKARQATLDLEALFRRIDSMPMRRAEMRRQE